MLQREIAIKDSRLKRIDPKKRPHYLPTERLEILAIRAMRGWSHAQVAKRFQVTIQTVINWVHGVEDGDVTVQMQESVNKYPVFVQYIVQQLKSFCLMLGWYKIADILARAGLHLSASKVKRMIDEPPIEPDNIDDPACPSPSPTVVSESCLVG
jgi:transcriptional regulator with XRE-family HTH domain